MYPYFKYLFVLSLLINFTDAQERFVDESAFHLAHNTLSEKYCKAFKAKKHFCKAKKLSYIDTNVTDLPAFLKGLETYMAPIFKEYRENHLKNDVLSTIKEFNGDITGEWYDDTRITLFAKTPATYTLSFESSGYSGGAHGYYTVTYTNIDIKTQKRLTLQNLFLPDYDEKLHSIARSYYKKAHDLKPSESLASDGWFENKFVLAENFAITPYGLYFLYNQYEIKSYADGQTEFFLPYSAIRELIDPNGPLAFARKASQGKIETAFENEQMQLSLDVNPKGDEVTITAHLTPLEYAKHAWLSVSLPQIGSKRQLLSTGYEHFGHLIPYGTKNKIYNSSVKKAIRAKYMLLEADKRNPEYDKEYTMWFRIKVPPKIKTLTIDIRATLKKEKMTYTLPDEYEGVKGQQGYKNYRILLPL